MSNRPRQDADDDFDDDFEDEADELDDAPQDEPTPAAPASRRGDRDRDRDRDREAASGGGKGRASREPAAGAADAAIHVSDNPSKWFVIGAIVVFVLILLNGMILGVGGLTSPIATPTPVATAAPSPTR